MTPDQIAADKKLCQEAAAGSIVFGVVAHERWPLYIAEVERLRAEIEILQREFQLAKLLQPKNMNTQNSS